MKDLTDHLHPVEADSILSKLNFLNDTPLIISEGLYGPSESSSARFLFFCLLPENKMKFLDSFWSTQGSIDFVCKQLSKKVKIIKASCDAMYATKPIYLWYVDHRRFFLYKKKNLALTIKQNSLKIKMKRKWLHFGIENIVKAKLYVGSKIGIKLLFKDTSELIVAFSKIPYDSTYDDIDLWGDSLWAELLGSKICEFLKIPLERDEAL